MCWNFKVSIITFIIGTVLNVLLIYLVKHYPKNREVDNGFIAIAIIWEYVMLMQLFEALSWKGLSVTGCTTLNRIGTAGAYLDNFTQPLVVVFVLLYFMEGTSTTVRHIVMALLFIYILSLLYEIKFKNPQYDSCLQPTATCSHFEYPWWTNMTFTAAMYFIIIFTSILLILRPLRLAIIQAVYIALTLIVSWVFYSCSIASMWCWFAALAPLLNIVLWYLVPVSWWN